MSKRTLALTAVLAFAFALAGVASAANPHLIGDVSFTDAGETLNAQGSIAGLGNEDTVVFITATGIPTVTCTNPSGANQPPGQNPAELDLAGGEEIPSESIRNGRLDFSVSTAAPTDPSARAAGCPSNKWTAQITDVEFTSATLSFYQGKGCRLQGGEPNDNCTLVFSQSFTP